MPCWEESDIVCSRGSKWTYLVGGVSKRTCWDPTDLIDVVGTTGARGGSRESATNAFGACEAAGGETLESFDGSPFDFICSDLSQNDIL